MQSEYSGNRSSVLYWILGINLAVFVLDQFFFTWFQSMSSNTLSRLDGAQNSRFFADWLALSVAHITELKIWTFATYSLMHGNFMHIAFNSIGIFMFGRALEDTLGSKRLLQAYIATVLIGGLAWLLLNINGASTTLIGASAGAAGLIILFCAMEPEDRIQLLLFFAFPVQLKRKWLAWALIALNGIPFLMTELPRITGTATAVDGLNIAYSAHLGGMLAGYLFWIWLRLANTPSLDENHINIEPPAWLKKSMRESSVKKTNFTLNPSSKKATKAEVDRILDKINNDGFGALSEEEKKTLEKVSKDQNLMRR